MQITAAEVLLKRRFHNVERMGDILRADYCRSEQKIASYWFDFSDELPGTTDTLHRYADRVIGPSYFADSVSPDLRWNFYLYFVAGQKTAALDQAAKRTLKDMIESDRSFARKFVVNESQLDEVVESIGVIATANQHSQQITNVAEIWRGVLRPAGLEFLLEEMPLTDKLRRVAQEPTKNIRRGDQAIPSQTARNLSGSSLTAIDLTEYRASPRQKIFEGLGQANLIFGPNGVGKTTFLEAIEYFYCGGNLRNPKNRDYKISAEVPGIGNVVMQPRIANTESRGRLRCWYGLNDSSKHNPLPAAFGRFNFMNVDAAAKLMLRGAEHEELIDSLKQLIGGEEATLMEARLRKAKDGLATEASKKSSELKALSAQLIAATAEHDGLLRRPTEVDVDLSLLSENLHKLGWSYLPQDGSAVTQEFIRDLTSFSGWVSRALSAGQESDGVTTKTLKNSLIQMKQDKAVVEAQLRNLATIDRKQAEVMRTRSVAEQNVERLKGWSAQTANEVIENTDNLASTELRIASTSQLIDGYTIGLSETDIALFASMSMSDAVPHISRQIEISRDLVSTREQTLHEAKKTQGAMAKLVTQLVLAARKLTEHAEHPEDCPLCGQHYESGELAKRIAALESSLNDTENLELAKAISDEREFLDERSQLLRKMEALDEFGRNARLTPGTVEAVHNAYLATVLENTRLIAERRRLLDKAERLFASGLSMDGLLRALGVAIPPPLVVQEALDSLHEGAEAVIADATRQMDELIVQASAARSETRPIASRYGLEDGEEKSVPGSIDTHIQAIQDVLTDLDLAAQRVRVEDDQPLAVIDNHVKTALLQAMRVQEANVAQSAAGARQSELQRSMARLEQSRQEMSTAASRLSTAHKVVEKLLEVHSLQKATEQALQTVHDVADGVFSRIHTPSEYRINASLESPLMKKTSEDLVDISEVSSGQRAAYALSLFIAMNAEAKKSPKVMLLDDPIAHIDDLNALSFLDYLRDIALQDQRQIFFATADDKLAGLFAHKFGFLGDELRTIELDR